MLAENSPIESTERFIPIRDRNSVNGGTQLCPRNRLPRRTFASNRDVIDAPRERAVRFRGQACFSMPMDQRIIFLVNPFNNL